MLKINCCSFLREVVFFDHLLDHADDLGSPGCRGFDRIGVVGGFIADQPQIDEWTSSVYGCPNDAIVEGGEGGDCQVLIILVGIGRIVDGA